jgi:predicted dehydrogenase
MMSNQQKRYVHVGVGGRAFMYTEAAARGFPGEACLVGLCDNNKGRLDMMDRWVKKWTSTDGGTGLVVPLYAHTDFDRMVKETRPDTVIVTCKDAFHDEYICRAMELGCDVITEKPMTTDATKCQRIVDTQKKTGRKVRVTFNYRYSPPRTQIKDLLMKGTIGEVLSVDFHWMLDTYHGADYFRRWHRNKANSGGLMVHKATHHFDLVNWWLSDVPERVYASGHRRFYTAKTADRLGLTRRQERCRGCPEFGTCPFGLDLAANKGLTECYLDCEQYDGYFRDRCVFSPEIDIEDSMNVVVDYAGGTKMSYSLNAFNPWEGYAVAFNGTKGRLEHMCQETVYINGDGSVPGAIKSADTYIRVYPTRKPAYNVELWKAEGGHGGGDEPLVRDVFSHTPPVDPYKRAADQRSGAWSILVGAAANQSMANNRPFRIAELCQNIGLPDYPSMPTGDGPRKF